MDLVALRNRMVDEQLIPRGISDKKVLEVFRKTPRHLFVPDKEINFSYEDYPLSIGHGQTISQPFIVALMTQELNLEATDKVLEIGTGSGYQAAILAQLCQEVYSVERIKELAENAKIVLEKLNLNNIHIKVDDGTLGWEELAPFDKIIITAASPEIPQDLLKQLKTEGELMLPLGGSFSQMLTLVIKGKSGVETKDICPCVFVKLIGEHGWKEEDTN